MNHLNREITQCFKLNINDKTSNKSLRLNFALTSDEWKLLIVYHISIIDVIDKRQSSLQT